MTKIEPFEKHAPEYEAWFGKNRFVYESELRAIKGQLPERGEGIEVGVGSGRFAAPLGIKLGVDPSRKMRKFARGRGPEIYTDNLPSSIRDKKSRTNPNGVWRGIICGGKGFKGKST